VDLLLAFLLADVAAVPGGPAGLVQHCKEAARRPQQQPGVRGAVLCQGLVGPARQPAADAGPLINPAYLNIGESLVRELSRMMSVPGMISLAGGYPGPELFDRDGIRDAAHAALTDSPVACLQYGPTEGLPGLRESICEWMSTCGTTVTPDDVLVTGGSQQGFDLLVRTLLAPGDAAMVERPTYTGPLRVLKVAGVKTITVGVDAQGLDVDELESLLRDPAVPRPKLLYVVPTFANPSGATMPIARRLKLLALALEYRFVIVEDDPYGQLRFEGEPVPHVAALVDRVPGSRDWVVHLGSFSKVIAPGLRVAWLTAPPALRRARPPARGRRPGRAPPSRTSPR
jgi:DNA-binding transcriptional MocR family regulator